MRGRSLGASIPSCGPSFVISVSICLVEDSSPWPPGWFDGCGDDALIPTRLGS